MWSRRQFLGAAAVLPLGAKAATPELVIAPLGGGMIGVNGSSPGPLLQWTQGGEVAIKVTNRLDEVSSIHWHGIRTPSAMDGVPGLSFAGIPPGESFTYRFTLHQYGTYWYHSHSGFQEQVGLLGPIIVAPRKGWADKADRDYVVLLSEKPRESPERILSKLKFQSDAFDFQQPTLIDALKGRQSFSDQLMWRKMRMTPSDIADVTGSALDFLLNGQADWNGLFRAGETVRLRFINAATMSFFDVRVPDLGLQIVAADGNDVVPVAVDEFRIAPGETYDVLVRPANRPYRIMAQAFDRSGVAVGNLTPQLGLTAPLPPMDPAPRRTMQDMGNAMPGMAGMDMTSARLDDPGDGLAGNGHKVLVYADLRARVAGADPRPASREITLHLTGSMQRYIWSFDGKKYSQSAPIRIAYGERVRITLVNDTMMDHPIHLHGLWSELDNGQDEFRPYKHTIIVKPAERLSFFVTADNPGAWAFHCHLLYHMATGMMRVVEVA